MVQKKKERVIHPLVECKYNPICDIAPVNQLGVFDLAKAYATGSIPANVAVTDTHYNGVLDPRSISGRASDVFEAMQAEKAIRDYKPETSGDQ